MSNQNEKKPEEKKEEKLTPMDNLVGSPRADHRRQGTQVHRHLRAMK